MGRLINIRRQMSEGQWAAVVGQRTRSDCQERERPSSLIAPRMRFSIVARAAVAVLNGGAGADCSAVQAGPWVGKTPEVGSTAPKQQQRRASRGVAPETGHDRHVWTPVTSRGATARWPRLISDGTVRRSEPGAPLGARSFRCLQLFHGLLALSFRLPWLGRLAPASLPTYPQTEKPVLCIGCPGLRRARP